jgi:hypothetical protein
MRRKLTNAQGRTDRQSDATLLPRELTERLHHLESLQENWDGYGAIPPTSSALAAGREALHHLVQDARWAIDGVFVVPAVNGGVRLEWVSDGGRELTVIIPAAACDPIHFYRFSTEPALEEDIEADDFASLPIMLEWVGEPSSR